VRTEALFINGVYRVVLAEILEIQAELPEHIVYLQPYSGGAITHLRDAPPSIADPMLLVLSVTEDLPRIHYAAELVGWDDKTRLSAVKRSVLKRIIGALEPGEKELYDASVAEGGRSVNLLHVRRTRRVPKPFRVTRLIKTIDGTPVSDQRTTAGGVVLHSRRRRERAHPVNNLPNKPVEPTAGSRALAAATHRRRYAAKVMSR
jgi:hypothetical protein